MQFRLRLSPNSSRRLAAWGLVGFLLAGSCAAASKENFPGESAKWRRYESLNFELFSANRDGESRDLLHNLELLRALFFETFKVKERQPQEVTVYFFDDERAFKAYCDVRQRQTLAGYYLYRPDRAVIAVSPLWSDETQRYVIFHEYIHHLNRVIGSDPPIWYNEGVAELFSTIEVEKGRVLLGKPLPWHVDSLRKNPLLPLDTLFAVDGLSPIYNNGKHSGQFYAESWALLHFWRYGNSKLDKGKFELFLRYLLNAPAGTDSATRRGVFQEVTGLDFSEMENLLKNYVRGGTFAYYTAGLPAIPDAKTYASRAVPHEEIRERLAELSLRVNQSPDARLAMLQAAAKSSGEYRAWEALGTDAWSTGELDVAEERWQRAIDAGSSNPAIFHEVGQIECNRWFAIFDYYFRLPQARAEQLRMMLKRSIRYAPDQFAAYEMLAWVEATVAKPDIANINLVQERFKTLRHRERTLVALALVRIRLEDQATAIKVLDQLDGMKPDYWVACAAETIRAKLESRAPRKIERPDDAGMPSTTFKIELR